MSPFRKTLRASLILIVVAFASTVAHADTVVLNENFAAIPGGVYFSGTTVGQFTVQSGAVEVLDAARDINGCCAAAGGSPTCISLGVDAESISTGSTFVSTSFFAPGTYDLFFDLDIEFGFQLIRVQHYRRLRPAVAIFARDAETLLLDRKLDLVAELTG